jgi:Fic-DOC domain mobile mystery protein B
MGMIFDYQDGQTSLDPNETEGLKISSVNRRSELDEFEQANIQEAMTWVLSKKFKASQVLTEVFICRLHKRMFGKVWSWGGEFRTTDKNIGVDKWMIGSELKKLFEDTLFQIENKSWTPDEIVLRFKHRLVLIHCFPNGNGRHARLMADLLINRVYSEKLFSWGMKQSKSHEEIRKEYIESLRSADHKDFEPLLKFARS